jgi:hypothetical protein
MPQICKHEGCKWPVFSRGRCKIHQWEVKNRAILSPVSAKRAKENTIYHQKASAFKKLFPMCAAKLEGCTNLTTQVHHSKGRIGDNLLDETTFVPVCHNCHRWIEENPIKAKEYGFSKSRLSK